MAISILESDRLDRYELEIFIGQLEFMEDDSTDNKTNGKKSTKSKSKKGESVSNKGYTVKTTLENVLSTELSNFNKDGIEPEDQCSIYYEHLTSRDSLPDTVKRIGQRYVVDEKPVCSPHSVCYNISYKEGDSSYASSDSAISKGVICIFACVPKTLITILQKHPLELTVFQGMGHNQTELGTASVPLSGPAGFSSAVAYHFYEKGYDTYSHSTNRAYEIKTEDGGACGPTEVGRVYVRLRLTCWGLETEPANRVLPSPGPAPLRPAFADQNPFDYPFDERVIQAPARMTYVCSREFGPRMYNRDVEEILHRHLRVQDNSKNKPCPCPCKEMLENIKTILFDAIKTNNVVCGLKAGGSTTIIKTEQQKCDQDTIPKYNPCPETPPTYQLPSGYSVSRLQSLKKIQ